MNHMQGGPSAQQQNQQIPPNQQQYNNGHHGTPRRDYHAYAPSPQSPIHPQPYMAYHSPYWHNPYAPQPRWHPQQYQAPQYMPPQMQQPQYPPRSPMMMTSPHRPAMQHLPSHSNQSPRPVPQYMHYQAPSYPQTPSAQHSYTAPPEQSEPVPSTPSRSAPTAPFQPSTHVPSQEYSGPLPWYFPPGEGQATFPKAAAPRRRRRRARKTANVAVALPQGLTSEEPGHTGERGMLGDSGALVATPDQSVKEPPSEASTVAAPSEPETPATSHAPSEDGQPGQNRPVTPGQSITSPKSIVSPQGRQNSRSAIAVPNIAGLSRAKPVTPKTPSDAPASQDAERTPKAEGRVPVADVEATPDAASGEPAPAPAPAPIPKSWADLVRRNNKTTTAALANGDVVINGFPQLSKSASLAEALKQYSVRDDTKLSFLEPRGLVNTGNMCYMNSILQVLVFCAPFYSFLDQIRQRTVHSMKSDTPLVDAMIMFMREFKVLASAESTDVLKSTLKQEQLEMYGEPVTPEYVYDVIRTLPRFASMRRGHQQDAEEFLGFLLEGLHDECAHVMQGQSESTNQSNGVVSSGDGESPAAGDGWQGVGPKQKAALTRTAGQEEAPSPITKIFGGHFRSELRVPGLQTSAVYEPFKPLQLDIGAQDVNNIVDALKGLTRIESLDGQFGGRANTAKKQVFIHDLPPVLILHLKRFQYDLTGTQKIWKKVGYPLELEIPKEVFAPAERKSLAAKGGLPRYRLNAVVYHHGKSAAGGHYTVDVLRQDGREWVRMDDTYIRRVRPEDVAEAGAEEDPKVLAKAMEKQTEDQDLPKLRNIYQGLDDGDKDSEEEGPWSEVNGTNHANGTAKRSGATLANGTSTATTNGYGHASKLSTSARKENIRDNKVAYILLYERIRG